MSICKNNPISGYFFIIFALFTCCIANCGLFAQVSLTAEDVAYTQDFNSLANSGTSSSMPTGWLFIGKSTYSADNGNSTAGNVYSYGSTGSTDRALGTLFSSSVTPWIGAGFTNNTGATITILLFSYTGEQWRLGTGGRRDSLWFQYSTNATSLSTGDWTRVPGLDFWTINTTTGGAYDGNQSANRRAITGAISGLSIANGATFYIRWNDYNASGADDGLAVDDFSLTPNPAGGVPVIGHGTASFTPSRIPGGVSQTVSMKFKGESPYTITNANMVLPSNWTWPHSTGNVSITGGGSPTTGVFGDTVKVSGLALTANDSIYIQVSNITPPDSTRQVFIPVFSGTNPDTIRAITTFPSIIMYGPPQSIGSIKVNDATGTNLLTGQYVTTRGIVTVANEFGGPGYIQDNDAGIAIYDSAVTNHVSIGDEIVVLGQVNPYSGLCELTYASLIQVVGSGNTIEPLSVTLSQLSSDGAGGVENYEGMLVRVNSVTLTDTSTANNPVIGWTVGTSGMTYRLHDATGILDIRVDNGVNYVNDPTPPGAFDAIGVVSQYKLSSPYIGGYQLMPRFRNDIIASGPRFATFPVESNLTPTSLTISWSTVNNGTTRLRYGTTSAYEMGTLAPDDILGLSHAVDLSGLTAATVYHVLAFSVGTVNDTSFSSDLVVSTSSPSSSTGQTNVYFNFSVDPSVSLGEVALGNQDLVSKIVTRINNAQYSIDACLYNLSGSVGATIASALVNAKNRGVKVRVIYENENSNAPFTTLSNAGIPVINDTYDGGGGAGLMHNKFYVFDYRGGSPENIWIWGGSWNPTDPGTTQDHQNSIEIQDVALAGAYTMEFNQMWGSNTDTPNPGTSRFGARKTDITPHKFLVNGMPVSLYFSPSDHTTMHIGTAISTAQHTVAGCIMTLTRKDLADSLIAKKNKGEKVRIVVDNNSDQGNQISYLQAANVDIHVKTFSPGILHHKYVVMDGDQITGNPIVVTGSHNWSSSAENSNDENTLIIQSRRVANLYLQECSARYTEAGGTDPIQPGNSPLFSSSKSSIDFGTVLAGVGKRDSLVVTNSGTQTLSISSVTSSNARFTVDPTSATLDPSNSQKFYVTFTPNVTGATSGYIRFVNNAPELKDSVAVTGTGSGTPIFSCDSASIDFDSVIINHSRVDSFIVSNPGASALLITSITWSNPRYDIIPLGISIPALGSQKFTITFSPLAVGPHDDSVFLGFNAPPYHDTLLVHGIGRYPDQIDAVDSVSAGWNMVSLPVLPPNGKRYIVFPDASTPNAFAYRGSYVQVDSLEMFKGYWLKFPAGRKDTITGAPLSTGSIPVVQGWNMIGAFSTQVDVASLVVDPPGNISTSYWKYDNGYAASTSLVPGAAYWVKARNPGTLSVSAAASDPKMLTATLPDGMNQLTISDANGRRQMLYFGEQQEGSVSIEQYDLPPVPPAGAFDARWATDKFVAFHEKTVNKTVELGVRLQASKFPITISWNVADGKKYVYTIGGSQNGRMLPITGSGQATFSNASLESIVLNISPAQPLPLEYSLGQNYPNPFNPSTAISYGLPGRSAVKLTVFNAIGEEIATLVNGEQEAGFHSVNWQPNVSTGIYFYRLQAVDVTDPGKIFSQMKKMAFIK